MKLSTKSKLDEIAKLEKNWDSYGADPIPPIVVTIAREVAEVLEEFRFPEGQPVPGADGSIAFEWHKGNNSIELTITKAGISGLFVKGANGFYAESDYTNPETSGGFIPE